MPYETPIFDRTADDIASKTAKAFLNVADWIRIYGNAAFVHVLVAFLVEYDPAFNTLDAPSITTIPGAVEFNQFLENIEALRAAANLPEIPGLVEIKDDWLGGPLAAAPDYEDANDWERVLEIVRSRIILLVDYRMYCGVPEAGQARFYQHRWRLFPDWAPPSDTPVRRPRTVVALSGTNMTRQNKWRRYD
jgi:hypothetical protein